MGQSSEALYEVFRASKRLGPYDKERLARSRAQLDEAPPVTVGTIAADTIRRLAQLEGVGAEVLRRTARFWCSVVAAHIRCEFTKEQSVRLGKVWDRIDLLAPYTQRRNSKRVLGLWFKVPGPPDMSAAVLLSALFGTEARRLKLCEGCDLPFVTDAAHPQRRTCDDCLPQRQHGLKAWHLDDPGLKSSWDRFQHRLAQRVYKGKMTPQERDELRRRALIDLRRVRSGEMRAEEWLRQWDNT